MQQLRLHNRLYQISRIDETEYSKVVFERLEKIKLFKQLRSEGCSIQTACKSLGVPISTLYRWNKAYKLFGLAGLEANSTKPNKTRKPDWPNQLIQKVLFLRKQNPIYGKAKITHLLKRDQNTKASESTVGRIITYLIKTGQIKSVSFYFAKKVVRPRKFNNHAQRWKRGMRANCPGELLQIDHMSVAVDAGFNIKHFQATCPTTKLVVEQAYSCATSNIAKQFLEHCCEQLPFKIKSIQVDGGSEFKKDFEQTCKDLDIPLYVLPPRSPELNGNVERSNGAAKFEFYAFYSGDLNLYSLRKSLQRYVKKYNSYRPHQALQYLTPEQYYNKLTGGSQFFSIGVN